MNPRLLEVLMRITPEEQRMLDGYPVDDGVFFQAGFVKKERVLKANEIISMGLNTRFRGVPNHRHDFIEIMYVYKGTITHVINNIDVVMEAGDILLLNQHAMHAIKTTGLNDIGVNLFVLPEFFETSLNMLHRDNFLAEFIIGLLRRKSGTNQYLHFKLADNMQTNNLMENLIYSLIFKQENYTHINQALMGVLFLYLLENAKCLNSEAPNNYEDVLLRSVYQYINQNYTTATLTEAAANIRVPISYLSRLIKKKSGFTFKELLQKRRFEAAKTMLCNTSLSICDIVTAVGYENNSYFHRRFRQKYNISPNEFRILNAKKGILPSRK